MWSIKVCVREHLRKDNFVIFEVNFDKLLSCLSECALLILHLSRFESVNKRVWCGELHDFANSSSIYGSVISPAWWSANSVLYVCWPFVSPLVVLRSFLCHILISWARCEDGSVIYRWLRTRKLQQLELECRKKTFVHSSCTTLTYENGRSSRHAPSESSRNFLAQPFLNCNSTDTIHLELDGFKRCWSSVMRFMNR